jgi:hypothetical protein
MVAELATSDLVVAHHARVHVTGQVMFRGEIATASILVERTDGSDATPVDLDSSVETWHADRTLLSVCGDTPEPLPPGAYRVRLLVARKTGVMLASVRHVLLSSRSD